MRPSADTIRVALIGYGTGGAVFHAPLIAAAPETELAAIVTADPGRRARAAAHYPGAAILDNTGQDCCARTRILVQQEVYDDFLSRFETAFRAVRVGDPSDEATQVGPLISAGQRDMVAGYVDGADVAFSIEAPDGPGYWFDPQVVLPRGTDDVVWRVQGAPDVPTIGTRYGKDEVREWLELFPHHFQPLDFDIQRMVADDDRVIVIGHFTHRILDTGREFSSDFATICTVRDGKLAAYNFLEDSYGLWDAFQPVDS